MAFYRPDASMDQRLASLLDQLVGERGPGSAGGLSISWLRYSRSLLPAGRAGEPGSSRRPTGQDPPLEAVTAARGASWQGSLLRDPGLLVQLPYLVATERWLQRGLLEPEPELQRALAAMIRHGSHEATSYVVDRLSGTTSGPTLVASAQAAWRAQRSLVNGWLASLGWPELEGCRAVQKLWFDGPYGRERDWSEDARGEGNHFCSDGLARLLEGVLAGTLISPPACQRMRALLAVAEWPDWLGPAGPADGRQLWGQACSSRGSRGLALYAELEGASPTLLVLLAAAESSELPNAVLGRIAVELLHGDG